MARTACRSALQVRGLGISITAILLILNIAIHYYSLSIYI